LLLVKVTSDDDDDGKELILQQLEVEQFDSQINQILSVFKQNMEIY